MPMHTQTSSITRPPRQASIPQISADPTTALAFLVSYLRAEARAEAQAVYEELKAFQSDSEQSKEEAQEVVSVRDGAALLGVCVQTIYNLASKGIVKPYKLGGRTVYRRSELLDSLQAQTRTDGLRKNARRNQQQKRVR